MAKQKTFFQYFEQNMKEMGLPAPSSLFGTLTAASTTIGAMSAFVKTYGTSATVAEFFLTLGGGSMAAGGGAVGAAVVAGEVTFAIGSLAASFYAGACVGSLAVATGKKLADISIIDCIISAKNNGIKDTDNWLMNTLSKNPAILNPVYRRGLRSGRVMLRTASAY